MEDIRNDEFILVIRTRVARDRNELDSATSTIKQGLNVDPGNTQLTRLMRTIKSKKASAKAAQSSSNAVATAAAANNAATASSGGVDSSLTKEIIDLQTQLRKQMW